MRRSGFLEGILVLIVLASGILGWGWLMQVTVERVDVRGSTNALPDEIRELAGVGSFTFSRFYFYSKLRAF